VPTQVEQVVHCCVGAQKPLCLISGFEPHHATFSDPHWLMRKLSPVVGVSSGIVDCIRDQFPMSNAVALYAPNFPENLIYEPLFMPHCHSGTVQLSVPVYGAFLGLS
jgi:hypothetical protein